MTPDIEPDIQPHHRTTLSDWTTRLSLRTATGPWFDPIALYALKRWMFPLSRLWAAANAANGDVQAFLEAAPITDPKVDRVRIEDALVLVDEARLTAEATDVHWERTLFSESEINNYELRLAERARRSRRHIFYAARRHFRFLRTSNTPLAKQRVETREVAAERFGHLIANKEPLAGVPQPMPRVEVSHAILRPDVTEQWLRFPSPSKTMNDTATAHVFTPVGVANPPTLIFGHGVCVETEHWKGLLDEVATLVAGGIRVIRPEAPWHGYRTPHGYYGGERIIEVFPSAAIEAFSAAIQEWAVLADWARKTSNGPLAFGGTSLGALTAQCAGEQSKAWPGRLRPDGLFLITHSANLLETIIDGDLTRLWGDPEKAQAMGWDADTAAQYLSLLDPGPYPAVPATNIVSVLGSRDRVTPFASGKDLLDRWGVPDANRFIWWRGHFSVPTTLVHDDAPVRKFCSIMNRL